MRVEVPPEGGKLFEEGKGQQVHDREREKTVAA
jgi:hypothetical protein